MQFKLFRTALPLLALVSLLTGCMTSKKLDGMIREHYNNEFPKLNNRTNTSSIQVKSSIADTGNLHSRSTQHTEKFLPLLLYWRSHYVLSSRINGRIPYTLIANSAQQQARNRKLEEKLAGRYLELTVNQLPQAFSLRYEEQAIFLLISSITWAKIYFLPTKNQLQVSYRLLNGNDVLKSGTVTLEDPNKLVPVNQYKSINSAVDDYLTMYDSYMKELGKQLVDKLAEQL